MTESTADDLSAESEEELAFKHNVFHVIVAFVIAGITTRYDAANIINYLYCFLCQYSQLSDDQILQACEVFGKKYPDDISKNELGEEVIHLKSIYVANFGNESLSPLKLLNDIRKFKLEKIFCNVCMC